MAVVVVVVDVVVEEDHIAQPQAAQLLSKHQDLISQLEVSMFTELYPGEQPIQPSFTLALRKLDASSMTADTHGAEPCSLSLNHAAPS